MKGVYARRVAKFSFLVPPPQTMRKGSARTLPPGGGWTAVGQSKRILKRQFKGVAPTRGAWSVSVRPCEADLMLELPLRFELRQTSFRGSIGCGGRVMKRRVSPRRFSVTTARHGSIRLWAGGGGCVGVGMCVYACVDVVVGGREGFRYMCDCTRAPSPGGG